MNQYLYDRKLTILNEHFLRLQKYVFEVDYTTGKTMLVSEKLSRSYLNDVKPKFDENSFDENTLFDMYISSFQSFPLVSPD